MASRVFEKHPVPLIHPHVSWSAPALQADNVYKMLLDSAVGGVWIVDLDGVIIYLNSSMAGIMGYSQKEMIGRSVFQFLDSEIQKVGQRNLEKRKQGFSSRHKTRLKHKDGSDVWVWVASNPFRDESGVIRGVFAFVTEFEAEKVSSRFDSAEDKHVIRCENIELHSRAFEVRIDGQPIDLTAFGFKLLNYFLERPGCMVTRKELMEKVWEGSELDDRVIDAHIVSLRKKLKAFHGRIKTVYGLGYILKPDGTGVE